MEKEKLLSIFGILLVLTLSSVMAISMPSKPQITELSKTDPDFRVPLIPFLSITGVDTVAVNTPTSHGFSLEAPYYPDKDISDLTYSWFFGIWAIMDNAGSIVEEIPIEKDLGTLKTYTGNIQNTFSESGTYYYVPAILEVKQEFTDGEWVVVSEEIIQKEAFKINVIGFPEKPFITKITDLFSRLWDWILGFFS